MQDNTQKSNSPQTAQPYISRAAQAAKATTTTQQRDTKRPQPTYVNRRTGVALWVNPPTRQGQKTAFGLSVPMGKDKVTATAYEVDEEPRVDARTGRRGPDATNSREGVEGIWFETTKGGTHLCNVRSTIYTGKLFLNKERETPAQTGSAPQSSETTEAQATEQGEEDLIMQNIRDAGADGIKLADLADAVDMDETAVSNVVDGLLKANKVSEEDIGVFKASA